MNPRTGEILAHGQLSLLRSQQAAGARRRSLAARSTGGLGSVRAGSVFKVITLSAALETTNLRPETIINCGNGAFTMFGRVDPRGAHGYGSLPMAKVLAKSSNIGAIQIGLTVGKEKLYEYVRRFGFGQRTGIPLAGGIARACCASSRAMAARPRSVDRHGARDRASPRCSLAQACSVIANGGLLVRPRLILKRGGRARSPSRGAASPHSEARDRHHDAQHDGRVWSLVRHRHQGAAGRLHSGGKTGSARSTTTPPVTTRTPTTRPSWDSRR